MVPVTGGKFKLTASQGPINVTLNAWSFLRTTQCLTQVSPIVIADTANGTGGAPVVHHRGQHL